MKNRTKRITDKCLKIYGRKKFIWYIYWYLEKLLPHDTSLQCAIWEKHVLPVVRELYFKDLTIETFLQKIIQDYRNGRDVISIWTEIDETPFTPDEYTKIVDLIDEALSKEPNPPTKEDWEELEEWLIK